MVYKIMTEQPAKIVTIEEFKLLKPSLGTVVLTSGFFSPIHFGHQDCFMQSAKLGDTLVVLVNGDWALTKKAGKSFQDLNTRCKIVSYCKNVNYVIPFEIENDTTVCKALEEIQPNIFTKGGDRTDITNIPEWTTCQKYGIDIRTGIGSIKTCGSSDFLKDWTEYVLNKTSWTS